MRLVKDILIVLLLGLLVFVTCIQEDDVTTLKTRTYNTAGNLWMINQRLLTVESGLTVGCDLDDLFAATVMLEVEKELIDAFGFKRKATGYSTGVFVADNALLTAKHSVKNRCSDTGVIITTVDNKKFTVKEIIEDADDDMALIIIDGTYGPQLKLGTRPRLGENLICLGSPFVNKRQLIMTRAKVASEVWKEDNTFIYGGFCFSGCSGGPVILRNRVVGIVKARRRGTDSLGFASPVERLDPEILRRIK